MGAFYNAVNNGLQDKLGSVLFQLHPQMAYSEERLEQIISNLDTSVTNVIEFRHTTWWRKDVINELKRQDITFCGISYPRLPDDVYKTAPSVYYRFHGVPQLYLSSYSKRKLNQVVLDIKRKKGVENVFVYFNNDMEVAAIDNARTIQSLV